MARATTNGRTATRPASSACPFCGGSGSPALDAGDNRRITGARFVYDRCEACGSLFLTNVPADLARYYYGSGYYGFRADGEAEWQGNEYTQEFDTARLERLGLSGLFHSGSYQTLVHREHSAP